jgi:hypothetical protein
MGGLMSYGSDETDAGRQLGPIIGIELFQVAVDRLPHLLLYDLGHRLPAERSKSLALANSGNIEDDACR